jgi:hypothetical protein
MKEGSKVKALTSPEFTGVRVGDIGVFEEEIELEVSPILHPEATTTMLMVNFGEKGRAALYPCEVKEVE